MTFAAPLWLLGLVPWSVVALYLIWGRRPRVDVPFLDLWPASGEGVKVRRRVTPPPVALALAILAMLLAILAAGQPSVQLTQRGPAIAMIVDRGWTMSAKSAANKDFYRDVTRGLGASAPIELWMVPGAPLEPMRTDASDSYEGPPENLAKPTALATLDELRLCVRQRLAESTRPVIVVSNLRLDIRDERVIQIAPERSAKNARIVSLAARETPAAQVMVRVRGVTRAKLRVTTGDQRVERDVSLTSDAEHDEFFDFSKLGQTIRADLLDVTDDDQPGDDTAWLVRESSWPRVEARLPLPAHVQRMLDVYARQRPPGEKSKKLVMVGSPADIPNETPAVVLPPASGSVSAPPPTEIADHPVTHGVSFSELRNASIAPPPPPPAGWKPVVSSKDAVFVAVRESPSRAVWIGFDSVDWAKSTDFVVFWANVLNWTGAGGEVFAAHPVGSLEGDWTPIELAGSAAPPEPSLWPGLYRRVDGTLRALSAPDVPASPPADTHWRERLQQLQKQSGQVTLSPWLALGAVLGLCGSVALWKRRPVAA